MMVRTQIYLTPEQHAALKEEAATRKTSLTALLRRIVDTHLTGRAEYPMMSKEEFLSYAGIGESDVTWVSEDTDAALYDAYRRLGEDGRPVSEHHDPEPAERKRGRSAG